MRTAALAQNVASTELPSVDVSPPTDQNKTRARPCSTRAAARAARGEPLRLARHRHGNVRCRGARYRDRRRRHRGPPVQRHCRHLFHRHHGGRIAHSPSNNLPDILAQVPGVQLTSLFGGVNGVKTSRRFARLRRLRSLQHADPDQRPAAQRHRHGAGRSVDHSAQFDRAHRDHPRQQRRGALWRQRGRRRHQHRHQERRRRSAGGDPRRGRGRFVQPAPGQRLRLGQLRPVVDLVLRQRHQVGRLSRQQQARPDERRSAASITRRPTSRPF